MGKIVIHDTADVTITDIATGKVVLNAEAQLAQVTGAISEEDLKGGIGNRKLYKIRTDKEVNLTMRSAVADVEYWAMTQGVAVDEAGEALVTEKATVKVDASGDFDLPTDFAGGKVAHIVVEQGGIQRLHPVLNTVNAGGTAVDSVVDLANEFVNHKDANSVTIDNTGALPIADTSSNVVTQTSTATYTIGEELTVYFQKVVTGKQIKIDSNKFAGKYKVEMKTIAYDLETATVTSDIYFLFPETIPAGEFDISLENGSVYTPEISFSVMNPIGSSELGEIIEVSRSNKPVVAPTPPVTPPDTTVTP